jgi:hypothetical protein
MKTISEIKENINGSLSSIYTREDVIKIVETIESFGGSKTPSTSKEFLEKVKDKLNSILSDVQDLEVDGDSIDFRVEYREIVFDSDDVEIRGKDEVESSIEDLINEIEEEESKIEDEEENTLIEVEEDEDEDC